MRGVNQVKLIGRVVDDIFYTTTGGAAADLIRFTLVTPAGEQEATHKCLAWGPVGLQLHTHLKKGNRVALGGKLTYHHYTNRFGQLISLPEIKVDYFTFIGD